MRGRGRVLVSASVDCVVTGWWTWAGQGRLLGREMEGEIDVWEGWKGEVEGIVRSWLGGCGDCRRKSIVRQ